MGRSETVRRYYELVDAADYETMFGIFCDDLIYERAGTAPLKGIKDFRRFYLAERKISSGRHSLDVIVESGDWVAARGVFTGELRNGQHVTTRWADFHHFRGDKIWRRYTYFADEVM
ncbi:nuclear transport factor 2 family protein [Streptomyces sp. NPDC102274]|uniref:nuclear transport factor 2 family protein n=1 Tax=Streptomyces sp. NPDC102274 TaxID=3366151 RepID=UPI0038222EE8